ncbi:hypothetical protein [Aquimarina macrocephali]|uniref:hypothetical protein n=1 Tax=Aquimarina macrocephali TaxID=666563 RepID=UPI00137771BD|nr:hypothetical protein [Aquimarina macrocephali]
MKTDRVLKEQLKQFQKIKKMTPERLRTFEGFKNVSDQEAEQTILVMEQLCKTIFNHIK